MFTLGASFRTYFFKFRSSVVFIVSFLALTSVIASSAEIKLAWDPNTESDLAGYKVYYGTSARAGTDPKVCGLCGYTGLVSLGNVTTDTVSNLASGQTYYFSVTAFDTSQNESGFSNEVNGVAADPTPAQYILTVSTTGSGSVTKNPDKPSYNAGDQVTLTATPGSGYSFGNWSGDVSGTMNPVTVTMSGNKTVTATFTQTSPPPAQYSLTVNVVGSGSVTKNPDKPSYNAGDQVTLTATADSGCSFGGWSGDESGSPNPVTLTMNGNKTVTATFVASGSLEMTPSVGLNIAGSRGGPFDPSNQTYSIQSSAQVPIRWKVAVKPRWLSTSPTSGSLAPGETMPITVSINSNAKQLKAGSYNATLVIANSVNVSDSLSRSIILAVSPQTRAYVVKSNPDGLQLVVDGQAYTSPQTFEWGVGASHTLEAPSPQKDSTGVEYVFNSWSNRKPQKQTLVAPSSAATYTANFKTQYPVTTSVNDSGAGIVVPMGTTWVDSGRRFSITAKPKEGYEFTNWSGDISGVNNPLTLATIGPINVMANFSKKGGQSELDSTGNPQTNLPMIGALESPSEGKRVLGLKTIYGWALDRQGISKVRLLIDGEYLCDIPYGGLRDDLKEAYPDYPNAEKGGYALVWNYSALPPGSHHVQIEVENVKGETLGMAANIIIPRLSGEMITEASPKEWLLPGANLIVDGKMKTYDLRLEWSIESQAFEITDVYPQ